MRSKQLPHYQTSSMTRLAEAGDYCHSCDKFWAHQGLEFKRMMTVMTTDGKPMTTEAKHIPIIVCPHCDGTPIFTLPKGS